MPYQDDPAIRDLRRLLKQSPAECLDKIRELRADNPSTGKDFYLYIMEGECLINLHKAKTAHEHLKRILPRLQEHDLKKLEIYCLEKLSYSSWSVNQLQEMLKYALKVDELVLELGDADSHPNRYQNIGFAYMSLRDFDNALAYLYKSEEILQRTQQWVNLVFNYNKIATIYNLQSEYGRAMEFYQKALSICDEHDLPSPRNRILGSLGILYRNMGQNDSALKYLLLSREGFREHPDDMILITILVNLGLLYTDLEQYRESIDYYREALEITLRLNQENRLFTIYNNMANNYTYLKDYEAAAEYFGRAGEFLTEGEDDLERGILLVNLGNVAVGKGDLIRGRQLVEQGMILLEGERNSQREIARGHKALGNLCVLEGNYKQAVEHLDKYIHQLEANFDREIEDRLQQAHERYKRLSTAYDHLRRQNELVSEELRLKMGHQFVGCSETILKVYKLAMKAASHPDVNVLITGESGVGKEIVARLIHHAGVRAKHFFCAINSSAISGELFESEFFGHIRGAFTGATTEKIGYCELANKGTLFLDEIADMPLSFQIKLLRTLEEKTIIMVGDTRPILVDFRVIASTNRDIDKLMASDTFRYDLYHRLNTIEIFIPPLRDRPEDIEPLIRYWIDVLAARMNLKNVSICDGFIEVFKSYHFPGNVRELKNLLERSLILSESANLDSSLAESILSGKLPTHQSLHTETAFESLNLHENERRLLVMALERSEWNQKKAADLLGISQNQIFRRMKHHQLK